MGEKERKEKKRKDKKVADLRVYLAPDTGRNLQQQPTILSYGGT